MGFTWETNENDAIWEEPADKQTDHNPNQSNRWYFAAVLAVLLGLAAWVTHVQIVQQSETREKRATAEVKTSYTLLREAVANDDLELLGFVLSGSHKKWSRTQISLFKKGMFLSYPFLEWEKQAPAEEINIALTPNLDEAEVRFEQTYTADLATGPQTVRLQHTALFRPGRANWLYTYPQRPFWGVNHTLEGEHLTLTFPARDEDIVKALHTYLDAHVARYCRLVAAQCPAGYRHRLRLETNPASIFVLLEPQKVDFSAFRHSSDIALPTPTLIGRPLDETSRELLFAQYATAVLTSLNAKFIVSTQRGPSIFDHAFHNQYLHEAGLPTYAPYHPSLLQTAAIDPPFLPTLGAYTYLWREDAAHPNAVYALRAFQLVNFFKRVAPDRSLLEMQRLMAKLNDFELWITAATGLDLETLAREWHTYVAAQTAAENNAHFAQGVGASPLRSRVRPG